MSFSFSSVNSNYTKFTSVATITSSVTISNTTPSTIVVQGNSSIVNITIPSSINIGSRFTIISNYSLGDNISYPDQRATFVKTSNNGNIARLRFNDQVTVTALQTTPTQPRHFASKIVRKAVSSSITKWTTIKASPPASSVDFYGADWSPELGTFCLASNGSITTSQDGITWTSRALSGFWYNMKWSPELGIFCTTNLNGGIATSPDGSTWTTRTGVGNSRWENLTWSPDLGLFCATGNNTSATPQIMTSPDGITWTSATIPTVSAVNSIAWSPQVSLFVAFTTTTNISLTSPDGITWTTVTSPSFGTNSGITWSPELGIFCGVANGLIATSPNGTTWTTRNQGGTSRQWWDVKWVSELGVFVVVNIDNTTPTLLTSPNGITWTSRSLPSASNNTTYSDITWSPELNMFVISAQVYDTIANNVLINTW